MTREDRIREMLAKLVEQEELAGGARPTSPLGKTTAMYIRDKQNATVTAWQAIRIGLAFADAEAAAMRERAAGVAMQEARADENGKAVKANALLIATAIRALPLASPALRDDREGG